MDVVKPQFNNEKTYNQLLALGARWRGLFPLSEEVALAQKSYDEDFLVRMAYNSNAIEGSTLTLVETEIIYEGEFVAGKPGREQVAAKGIFEASEFLDNAIQSKTPLSQEFVIDLHERCALDLQPRARGVYRNTPAIIRASRTVPVAAHKIRFFMDDLLFQYEQILQDQGALLAIPWFHAAFERIHPFADGNGRTGRLLMNYQLQTSGFPPMAIKVDNAIRYKMSLEEWQVDEKPNSFMELYAECLRDELAKRIAFLGECVSENYEDHLIEQSRNRVKSRDQKVLELLSNDQTMTAASIASKLNISSRQVQRVLSALKAEGRLVRRGSNKSGYWKVIDKSSSDSHLNSANEIN